MSSSSSSSLINILVHIEKQLTIFVYPLWLIFGITGCLLNLIIFSRPQLRTTSCSIYFFAASVDHLMTLIIGIGPTIYSLFYPDLQIQSLLFCKLRGYLFQICLMLSRWFIAFACIDRYVLTSDEVRLRNLANRKIACRALIFIIVVWFIICSHRLIFYEIKGTLCAIVNNMIAAVYHSIYVIIGGGICPTIIMILCASLIRRNLARKRERRTRFSLGDNQRSSLDQQVLRILFIQIISYVIFTIPQLCNLIFNTISITYRNRSNEHIVIERFVAFIAEFMLYLFPVTSFYLYTLTSRTFRKELIQVIYSIGCRSFSIIPMSITDQRDDNQKSVENRK
ncbi:hypothetical protein I4U23_020341 [Adineta vaga]|nr:hypothetical protein I4U23_020341 [Adineta vaga]